MKAMVLEAPAPIEQSPLAVAELPVPRPGPGEVVLQVSVCGLCHTDLHTVEGDLPLPRLPLVPGHQVVGTIAVAGAGVTWPAPGERVGAAWLHQACGDCTFCQRGSENLCDRGRYNGYHADGGYAQYVLAQADFVYPIPEGFTDEQAAPLLCGGVIGYRALCLSQVRPGEALGLYGFGASAHITIQVAQYWGCRVYVFTRSSSHQDQARRLGAAWAGKAEEKAPVEMDSSIIFAPAGGLVPLGLQALKRGGTLGLAGITMTPLPEMPYDLLYGERTVRTVANATRQDAHALLQLAADIPIHTEVQLFPLAEANEALRLLKAGRMNGAGVLKIAHGN